jgi:hypothetical protein
MPFGKCHSFSPFPEMTESHGGDTALEGKGYIILIGAASTRVT